jgi:hypothetical protein
MSLTPEQIEENWKKYCGLCEKTLGDRSPAALTMLNALEDRLALCPASGKVDFHNAFPGGLVEHSLRVLSNAFTLVKAFGWDVPKDSLVIGALFHDLGKVGDDKDDYYVTQDSEWHRDKLGENYKHNKEIRYMTVPDRGVWLCQHYGLKLTHDEYLAIKLNDGWVLQENKPYCLKEPKLAHVVMTADYIATMQEKGLL